MKIYDDDSVVPYKSTRIKALQTQSEINGLLSRWNIVKYGWEWDLPNDKVVLHFQFTEKVRETEVFPMVALYPPHIWTKGNRNRKEVINWDISMRVLHWHLKTLLEMVYLSMGDKTTAFLPHMVNSEGKSLSEMLIPVLDQMDQLSKLKALESKVEVANP